MSFLLFPLVVVLLATSQVLSAPVPIRGRRGTTLTQKFVSTSKPRFFVYGNQDGAGIIGVPPAEKLRGFNTYALAFLTTDGPQEKARQWEAMTETEREQTISAYHAAGIDVVVSVFGGVDARLSTGRYKEMSGAIEFANTVADWVEKYKVDGVDVDYEDYQAFFGGNAVEWVVAFTGQLRERLPTSIISHTPLAFQFRPSQGKPYMEVHERVGDKIDWYNIQYYNHDGDRFTTCQSLLEEDEVSVFQVAKLGVPLSKIVIAKPANSNNAGQGAMAPELLAQCLKQAKDKGWSGGVAVWQFPDADTEWIQTVRSEAFPVEYTVQ